MNVETDPNSDKQTAGYTLKNGRGRCSIQRERGQEVCEEVLAEFGFSGKKSELEVLTHTNSNTALLLPEVVRIFLYTQTLQPEQAL